MRGETVRVRAETPLFGNNCHGTVLQPRFDPFWKTASRRRFADPPLSRPEIVSRCISLSPFGKPKLTRHLHFSRNFRDCSKGNRFGPHQHRTNTAPTLDKHRTNALTCPWPRP